ncbi:MAG: sugar phosphate isomerase/epimerase family protein [Candidatus Sumerlaeia bacterium]
MKLSICSYSFHRTTAEGKMDVFSYIDFCKEFGCTQLDPWNAHLSQAASGEDMIHTGRNPNDARLEPPEDAFVQKVKDHATKSGLPWGNLAVDGGHIYDADTDKMLENRRRRLRWIEIAAELGVESVRVDAGGPEDMPDDVFERIADGYREAIDLAGKYNIEVLVENHWGPTPHPENVIRLMENVKGLGLLFDTNNWAKGKQALGWKECAKYARATHFKCLYWHPDGEEVSQHLGHAVQILKDTGYDGVWGIESVPREIDEYEGVKKTKALIEKYVKA